MTVQLKSLGMLVAASALWFLFTMPAFADSKTIKVGVNRNVNAYLMTPDGLGPYPAVLVLHTSGGLKTEDLEFAKRLAKEGYVALVPEFLEVYGIRPQTRKAAFTTYAQSIYSDFVASLNQLRSIEKVDSKKIGAIGFSNGGYFALWLAATNQVQAGISYYGAINGAGTDMSLSRFRQVFTNTSAPVLILHGTNDSTVPISNAIELDSILAAAQSPHEFNQYPGAEHRFDRDGGASNEAAAVDAWQHTQSFLSNILK
jgi:carboxymethylenebutenolidase